MRGDLKLSSATWEPMIFVMHRKVRKIPDTTPNLVDMAKKMAGISLYVKEKSVISLTFYLLMSENEYIVSALSS
jgi:hypothetical protein